VRGEHRGKDALARICGELELGKRAGGVLVEELDEQVLAVAHVVVERRGADAELARQTADGEPAPALALDDPARRGEDLLARGHRRAAAAGGGGGDLGHGTHPALSSSDD